MKVMHIISGILLSVLLKKGVDQKDSPSHKGFRGIIEVEHSMAGRIRYRVPSIKQEGKAELLAATLKKIKGITSIEINPVSAGILLRYDEQEIPSDMLTAAIMEILDLGKELEQDPEPLLKKEFTGIVKSLNRGVYESSNGFLDLYTLVPFSLIAVGLAKTIRDRQFSTPASLTLLWWAYQTFFISGRRDD